LPVSVKAQNSAISQNGNGESEQETKQGQSSNQDNQVVSGDSSILSGNSIGCQNQFNTELESNACPEITGTIPPDSPTAELHIKTVLRANCDITPCPNPDGLVQLFKNGEFWTQYEAKTGIKGGTTEQTFSVPVGTLYGIHGVGNNARPNFGYEGANIQGDCSGKDTCNAIMGPNGANVIVNFQYFCNDPIFC